MDLPTMYSLAEQMRMTDLEIATRKQLFDLKPEDSDAVRSYRTIISQNGDAISDAFYTKLSKIPEATAIIGDRETLSRLRNSIRRYSIELFTGVIDEHYVNTRLQIGKIHHRSGVTPKLFLSALMSLGDILADIMVRHTSPGGEQMRERAMRATRKFILFDTALIFDTYIHALATESRLAQSRAENHAVSVSQDVATRMRQIEQIAETDPVTNLSNRNGFEKQFRTIMAMAKRTSTPVTMIYLDIDNFKSFNDREGHAAGDRVLRIVAQALCDTMRASDIACRLGGDEFGLILPGARGDDGLIVAERLVARIDQLGNSQVYVSLGIAEQLPDSAEDPDLLVHRADEAMYAAKQVGRLQAEPTSVIRLSRNQMVCEPPARLEGDETSETPALRVIGLQGS
ncbi:MAG: GGDEF domain-containing protein [Alphaproteobacteria bacterium]|nr:GGDEF domain-containing protein [Alphaproteobacteria bacterium]